MAEQTIQSQQTLAAFEQQLRTKVEQGDPIAFYQIVEHFERKGLASNKLEAQNRINLLQESSNKGIGAASLLLGRWYLNGHYVNKDPAKAILFFEHAGNVCKDSYGFYQLAEMFQTGVGVKAQPEKGLQYLQKAVAMHNPEAIFTYANQLLKSDVDQALQLLKDNYKKHQHLRSLFMLNDSAQLNQNKVQQFLQANHKGDAAISALLAFRYLHQSQLDQAKVLADYAVEQENPIGYHVRALIELQDEQGSAEYAQQLMLKAAQLGHVEAAYRAALTTFEQADQTNDQQQQQQLLKLALPLLAQAAQAGFAPAQFSLGQCWLQGVGGEKNLQEGLGWIELAAQQGHLDATFTLAINLPVEHEQHLPLLRAAAQAGHPKAIICMGIYLQNHQQAEQAIQWFDYAKQHGDVRAYYLLGLAYRDGLGVEVDGKQAVELLNQAGEAGDADAYFALYQAYKDGLAVRRNKKSQAKYLKLAKQAQHPEALNIEE